MAKNDFRVTSIFKVIIRICMENVELCGKTSYVFTQKMSLSVHFLYFLFKRKGVKPVSMSNERSKNISNFKNLNSKTPEKCSPVTLVTNFHKLSLWSDPDNNF